jgi:uncharacterized phiE125 gp8 family phage protein
MTRVRNRLLVRTAAPASEPLTLTETKLYLRVDHASDDALITDLIVSARTTAEEWLKASLITQSWKLAFDDHADEVIELPMGPAASIISVTAVDRDGSTQTIASGLYSLNAAKNQLMLDSPLFGFRIEIVYAAGYGDASAVPKPIKYGMLKHIAEMYDHRGGESSIPEQAVRLYLPFREVRV